MQQHIKVLEFPQGINPKDKAKPNLNEAQPRKKLPPNYKNPKAKAKSPSKPKPNQFPSQPIKPKPKLISQDNYENIPEPKEASKRVAKSNESPYSIPIVPSHTEDPRIINTINLIANNPKTYKCTNSLLREIGRLANSKNLGFLCQKSPEASEPSSKLSNYLGEKLMEENKAKLLANEDQSDPYYNNLVSYIKSEMKKKGSFDFSKLSEKDRKLLAQKKLYDRFGGGNMTEGLKATEAKDKVKDCDGFEFKKKYFSKEDIPYENYSDGEKEKEDDEEAEDESKEKQDKKEEATNSKEKPSARQILENVLSKIELDNQMLVNKAEAKQKKFTRKAKDPKKSINP